MVDRFGEEYVGVQINAAIFCKWFMTSSSQDGGIPEMVDRFGEEYVGV
jgi:hypothetical protein